MVLKFFLDLFIKMQKQVKDIVTAVNRYSMIPMYSILENAFVNTFFNDIPNDLNIASEIWWLFTPSIIVVKILHFDSLLKVSRKWEINDPLSCPKSESPI